MKDRSQNDAMVELYRRDPDYALAFLNDIIENGDDDVLIPVLRNMTTAFGGKEFIAGKAHLTPRQLSGVLSAKGHSTLSRFFAILKAMGFHFSIHAGSENLVETVPHKA